MSDHNHSVGYICQKWWQNSIAADTGLARRTRAELRRCDTTLAVLGISAVHDLNRELSEHGFKLQKRPDQLALISVALAHVKTNQKPYAARLFGDGDPKKLSPIRFNALIRTDEPRDLMRPISRALKIIDGNTNVRKIAEDLYWWNEKVKAEWCFDYYGASEAKPINE